MHSTHAAYLAPLPLSMRVLLQSAWAMRRGERTQLVISSKWVKGAPLPDLLLAQDAMLMPVVLQDVAHHAGHAPDTQAGADVLEERPHGVDDASPAGNCWSSPPMGHPFLR